MFSRCFTTRTTRSMFHDTYYTGGRSLGYGGASVSVERCVAKATGQAFAAKRLSAALIVNHPFLMENEHFGLLRATCCNIPRTVRLVDLMGCTAGETVLITELIQGTALNKSASIAPGLHEQRVLDVTAQLLQTVEHLHVVANMCHLDISGSNVMLRTDDFEAWDQLRLIDFGFSQFCEPDLDPLDVIPQGTTPAYASPEVLKSLQLRHEGASLGDFGLAVNGPSADFWSVGMVVYEFLTGELPFDTKGSIAAGTAPPYLSAADKPDWEEYQAVILLQQTWLDACYDAHVNGTEVQHPLLDRVRQCSSNPEQAALFFCQILNPVPKLRQQAIHHAWCAETVGRMFEDIGIGYEPCYGSGSESDDGSDESNDVSHVADTLHQGKVSRCAALRRCFGCLDRPKVQETDEEICRMEAKAPGDHHSAAMPHPVPNSGRMRKCMQTTVSAAKSAASKIKFPFAKTARSNRGKFTQPLPGAVSAMELPVSANQTPIAAPVSANQSPTAAPVGANQPPTAAPVGANQPPTAAPVGANQPPTAAPDVAQQPNQAAVQIKAVRFSSDAVPISLTAVSTDGRVSQPSPARLKPQGSNGQTEHQAAEVTNTPLLDSEPCRETQDAPAAEPQHQSLPASESTSADRLRVKRRGVKGILHKGKKGLMKLLPRGGRSPHEPKRAGQGV